MNHVQLEDPNKGILFPDLMEVMKSIVESGLEGQDFIFITGIYRIEWHDSAKTFVVEQRHFDHVKLEEDEED